MDVHSLTPYFGVRFIAASRKLPFKNLFINNLQNSYTFLSGCSYHQYLQGRTVTIKGPWVEKSLSDMIPSVVRGDAYISQNNLIQRHLRDLNS